MMYRRTFIVACVAAVGIPTLACSRDTQAMTPDLLQREYGISGARVDTVATPDGAMSATIIPVTLADGRRADLIVPSKSASDRTTYLRDDAGFHPVELRDGVTPDQISDRPTIVERHAASTHRRGRSWEKEALIIGGSAGAGTAVGAIAGGKKGAAVGAAAGGIGGLIFDLATRHKG